MYVSVTSYGESGGASGTWVRVRGWGEVSQQRPACAQAGRDARVLEERAGAAHEEEGGSWEVRLEVRGGSGQLLNHADESDFHCQKKSGGESPEQYQEVICTRRVDTYPNGLTKAPWLRKPIALGFFSFDPT